MKALIYTQNSDYYNAIDNYKRSLSLYVSLKDTLGIAKVNNSLGGVEIARGNYTIGLQYALYAIDIFERKNQLNELSQAYRNLAIAYKKTNQKKHHYFRCSRCFSANIWAKHSTSNSL